MTRPLVEFYTEQEIADIRSGLKAANAEASAAAKRAGVTVHPRVAAIKAAAATIAKQN